MTILCLPPTLIFITDFLLRFPSLLLAPAPILTPRQEAWKTPFPSPSSHSSFLVTSQMALVPWGFLTPTARDSGPRFYPRGGWSLPQDTLEWQGRVCPIFYPMFPDAYVP